MRVMRKYAIVLRSALDHMPGEMKKKDATGETMYLYLVETQLL
jgi:hypothetical protein